MELKYYKSLDGVRGMAALMIMWFHFMPDGDPVLHPITHFLHRFLMFGQTGVTLFFVLSGFLITRILMFVKEKPHYFRNFYVKRALRISPLYYAALIVFCFLDPTLFTAHNFWLHWIYLQNFAITFNWPISGPIHFWSLAVEEHFYLFWPLIIYYTPKRHYLKVMLAVIAVAWICRIVFMELNYAHVVFTFSTMDCLVIGAILAWMESEGMFSKINFAVVGIAAIISLIPAWLLFGAKHVYIIQILKLPVISLFYMGLIGTVASRQTWLSKLFEIRFFRYTGKISYGLYVLHPFSFDFFQEHFPGLPVLVNGIGSFITAYLFATLSFYLFERYFIKLKKRFEPKEWKEKQEMQFE